MMKICDVHSRMTPEDYRKTLAEWLEEERKSIVDEFQEKLRAAAMANDELVTQIEVLKNNLSRVNEEIRSQTEVERHLNKDVSSSKRYSRSKVWRDAWCSLANQSGMLRTPDNLTAIADQMLADYEERFVTANDILED